MKKIMIELIVKYRTTVKKLLSDLGFSINTHFVVKNGKTMASESMLEEGENVKIMPRVAV